MNRLAVLVVLAATAFSTPAFAESTLGGGYYGDVVAHPGAYVDWGIKTASAGRQTFSVGADLGFYHHKRNHTGVFLRGLLAHRIGTSAGFFVEPRFNLGYLHTWVGGDDLWVSDSETGEVRLKTNGGDPNITYGLGVGLGWDFGKLAVILRPEITARAPYNKFALTQFALLGGIQWKFGGAQ